MKKSSFILIVIFSFLYLTSCTGTTDQGSTDSIISGKWNWIKSEGWPYTITPENIGYTKEITFMFGTYYEFRNNELYLKSRYEIVKKDINGDEINESIIVIDNLPNEYAVESRDNDILILRVVNMLDGTDLEYYSKIR